MDYPWSVSHPLLHQLLYDTLPVTDPYTSRADIATEMIEDMDERTADVIEEALMMVVSSE